MTPSILLTTTSWWPTSARLAIALHGAGCKVLAVCPRRGHPLKKTKAVEKVYPYSSVWPLQSIETAIGETRPTLIVPCDDLAVSHLHQLHECAAAAGDRPAVVDLIEKSLGSAESFATVSARHKLIGIAREEGLRAPRTAPVTTAEDLARWRAHNPLPWVLKTDGSWGGHGVRILRSQEEAETAFASMARPLTAARAVKRLIVNRDPFWIRPWQQRTPPSVSIQAYVRGYPANCAAFCWRGQVLAATSVEVIGSLSVTGSAAIVRVVENPGMIEAAERLAARLNLSGFFGFDFMIEEGSRKAFLIEMNPRCTPLCHLRLAGSQDLIAALYAQLTGTRPAQTKPVTRNDVIAYFPQAWFWNPASKFLHDGYNDVPWEEQDLTRELLRLPWPDRSFLARISDRFREQSFAARSARGCLFPAACADEVPNEPELPRVSHRAGSAMSQRRDSR